MRKLYSQLLILSLVCTPAFALNEAAYFDAANSERLHASDNSSISFGDEDFSIALWTWLDTGTLGSLRVMLSKFTGSGHREYMIDFNNATTQFRFAISSDGAGTGQATVENTASISPDTWYFIMARQDSTANTIEISVNDNTPASASHSGGSFDGTSDFILGARGDLDRFIDGRLDSVGVWRKKLSDAEVTSLYNSGAGLCYDDLSAGLKTSLEAWYELDETSGSRSDSHGSTTLTDANTVTQGTGVTSCSAASAQRRLMVITN